MSESKAPLPLVVVAMLITVQVALPTMLLRFKSPVPTCRSARLLVQQSGQVSGVPSKSLISDLNTAHRPHRSKATAILLLKSTDNNMSGPMEKLHCPVFDHMLASNAHSSHRTETMSILRIVDKLSQSRRRTEKMCLALLPCAKASAWSLSLPYQIVFERCFLTRPLTPYSPGVSTESSGPMTTSCLHPLLAVGRPSFSSSPSVELLPPTRPASTKWSIKRRQRLCVQNANVTGKPSSTN